MESINLPINIREWLSSVPVIVLLVITLVNRFKVWLANTPLNAVPIWVLACVISGALTLVANQVLHTIEGDWLEVTWQAVMLAAAGSGFREWWANGLGKPLSASGAAAGILAEKRQ